MQGQERNTTQKTDYQNNPTIGNSEGIPGWEKKKNYRLNLPLLNRPMEEDIRDLLNHLTTYNTDERH